VSAEASQQIKRFAKIVGGFTLLLVGIVMLRQTVIPSWTSKT
jgi:hypothetical protein